MPGELFGRLLKNLGRGEKTPHPADNSVGRNPEADPEQPEPPTLTELVQKAAETGALAAKLPALPSAVADTLRAIAAGERVPAPLAPKEIAQFGQVVAAWGIPYHRPQLPPWGSPITASELVDRLGLSPETAQRIAAVVNWDIGFLPEDFRDFAALSEEEAAQVITYLDDTHGTYTTGTRYAAP